MAPFAGEVPFVAGADLSGALVLFTESAENGEVWEAVAIPVRLHATRASPPGS